MYQNVDPLIHYKEALQANSVVSAAVEEINSDPNSFSQEADGQAMVRSN